MENVFSMNYDDGIEYKLTFNYNLYADIHYLTLGVGSVVDKSSTNTIYKNFKKEFVDDTYRNF